MQINLLHFSVSWIIDILCNVTVPIALLMLHKQGNIALVAGYIRFPVHSGISAGQHIGLR